MKMLIDKKRLSKNISTENYVYNAKTKKYTKESTKTSGKLNSLKIFPMKIVLLLLILKMKVFRKMSYMSRKCC